MHGLVRSNKVVAQNGDRCRKICIWTRSRTSGNTSALEFQIGQFMGCWKIPWHCIAGFEEVCFTTVSLQHPMLSSKHKIRISYMSTLHASLQIWNLYRGFFPSQGPLRKETGNCAPRRKKWARKKCCLCSTWEQPGGLVQADNVHLHATKTNHPSSGGRVPQRFTASCSEPKLLKK